MKGLALAAGLAVATVALIGVGIVHPVASAVAYAGGKDNVLRPSSTPIAAAEDLAIQIRLLNYEKAYSSLANKAQFTEPEFVHDLTGTTLSLRTYATLNDFDVQPLHQSANDAEVLLNLHWSTVVGSFDDQRDLHLVRAGDRWEVVWPLVKEAKTPPQVIPVNYLRWDVIYRGAGDDWGAQDVEAPHVRIVDMHPVNRADGVVVMGELLNEDVVPAFVSVRATLNKKDGSVLASEGSFDMMLHTLLPKQVTPFIIRFPDTDLSQVGSIKMEPLSVLISATADPVIEVLNQQYAAAPVAGLTGQLSNQSGQAVNVAHVLSTFYDKDGQVVWVGGDYIDRALEPETPVNFHVAVPADLARKISNQRTVVATYTDRSAS